MKPLQKDTCATVGHGGLRGLWVWLFGLSVASSFDLMLLAVPNGSAPTVSPLTNQLVAIGGFLRIHAEAMGEPPPAFQWQREGVNLLDGPRLFGAQSPDLFIQPALQQDSGDYTIIVSNHFGVAAAQANVRVVGPPDITLQPISQTAPFGSHVQEQMQRLTTKSGTGV